MICKINVFNEQEWWGGGGRGRLTFLNDWKILPICGLLKTKA